MLLIQAFLRLGRWLKSCYKMRESSIGNRLLVGKSASDNMTS